MSDATTPQTMSDLLSPHLAFLRRYARALAGEQAWGDRLAAMTLEAILAEPTVLPIPRLNSRAALYHVFHGVWIEAGRALVDEAASGPQAAAHKNLQALTPDTREALLLHTVEGFSFQEVGGILGTTADAARGLVEQARAEMAKAIAGRVLIIEDEGIIAADLEAIVESMGHAVVGIAPTRSKAVRIGQGERPDLILADIQLADNSSGIDAVHELLAELPTVPVIFITAFPERLLTGTRPEPTFLIAKPYQTDQVASAVSQAMFFASVETLLGSPTS